MSLHVLRSPCLLSAFPLTTGTTAGNRGYRRAHAGTPIWMDLVRRTGATAGCSDGSRQSAIQEQGCARVRHGLNLLCELTRGA